MDDFYTLPEELRAEYEREYNDWLDNLDLDEEIVESDTNSKEEDLFESYDESYEDEDEVLDYQDLLDTEEAYRELDFND